jgi:N-acetyl-gamma-glutamyl-phosphate reductase
MLLAETSGSFKAYGVNGHRHLPEIREILSAHCQQNVDLTFIPHLAPMVRGIHATLYGRLTADADLQALFEQRYRDEAFVDVMPAGAMPETRSVSGSNMCRIAVHQPQNSDTVVVLSVIDNLVKGASGQAIHDMNIMFGLPETTGINVIATMP